MSDKPITRKELIKITERHEKILDPTCALLKIIKSNIIHMTLSSAITRMPLILLSSAALVIFASLDLVENFFNRFHFSFNTDKLAKKYNAFLDRDNFHMNFGSFKPLLYVIIIPMVIVKAIIKPLLQIIRSVLTSILYSQLEFLHHINSIYVHLNFLKSLPQKGLMHPSTFPLYTLNKHQKEIAGEDALKVNKYDTYRHTQPSEYEFDEFDRQFPSPR